MYFKVRDSQKSKVYAAENSIRDLHMGAQFKTVEEIRDFLDDCRSHQWWKKRYGNWPYQSFIVRPGFGATIARGGGITLTLPLWARHELIIFHEVAHCLADMKYGRIKHNWPFAATFLDLVYHYMGADTGDALKKAFKNHRVKFRPKKQLSLATLNVLRERGRLLAAAKRKPTINIPDGLSTT